MAPIGHPDRAYEVAAAFFGELAGQGVAHVVVSPGSRSTPLTISAHLTPGLRTWVQIDERSAGFFALGLARATGQPVVLVCTSGTAAANYLPAVIEAHHTGVPLLVCTADRPPELREMGAGQTIDQVHLFGTAVRWFHELPVATEAEPARARRLAARVVVEATGANPGPIHLNWPLREPLPPVDWVGPDPAASPVRIDRPAIGPAPSLVDDLVDVITTTERGLIVAGPNEDPALGAALSALGRAASWPVMAEPCSQARAGAGVDDQVVLAHGDHLMRTAFAAAHRAEVVLRFGNNPTSKPFRLWAEACNPAVILVDPAHRWHDPSDLVTRVVDADPVALAHALADRIGPASLSPWATAWRDADAAAAAAIAAAVDSGPMTEPLVVRTIARSIPVGANVYVSNSMPIRDVDGFWPVSDQPVRMFANRGASGIDGLNSCALGVAAADIGPVVLLTGDIAFLHDLGGLLAGPRLGLDLTIVVVDNRGGAIFSFLPIAARGEAVAFDELFTTDPDVDLGAVAGLAGVHFVDVSDNAGLAAAVSGAVERGGVNVIRVAVDRQVDLDQHRELEAAVDTATRPLS